MASDAAQKKQMQVSEPECWPLAPCSSLVVTLEELVDSKVDKGVFLHLRVLIWSVLHDGQLSDVFVVEV